MSGAQPGSPPALRRALRQVAALCVLACAAAVLATVAAERRFPGFARAPDLPSIPLRLPRIDLVQVVAPGTAHAAVQVALASGLDALVNVAGGGARQGLEEALAEARGEGGRVHVLMNVAGDGCCDAAWAAREAGRLRRGAALGARGLALRGEVPAAALAAPAAGALWSACEALALPVVVAAPATDRAGAAAWRALALAHPALRFVDASGAIAGDDPAAALEALSNLELAVPALLAAPDARWAAAVRAHPDRVLFGSGIALAPGPAGPAMRLGPAADPIALGPLLGGEARKTWFVDLYRLLESRDRLEGSPLAPGAALQGLGLPLDALGVVYHGNAERLLGVALPREARP